VHSACRESPSTESLKSNLWIVKTSPGTGQPVAFIFNVWPKHQNVKYVGERTPVAVGRLLENKPSGAVPVCVRAIGFSCLPNPGALAKPPGLRTKKRPHKAGVKLLRQVSYRQETYRAVIRLYA
jgi:hypothetical protein